MKQKIKDFFTFDTPISILQVLLTVVFVGEMKEMKGVVERVVQDVSDPVYKADGIVIPSSMRVLFRNGDRLEILLRR